MENDILNDKIITKQVNNTNNKHKNTKLCKKNR